MNKTSIRNSILTGIGLVVLTLSSLTAFAETVITGASYTEPNTNQKISIALQQNGSWVENSPNGPFTYQMIDKDENSIYLYDKTRGLAMQLDLHRKLIIWGIADANRFIGQETGSYPMIEFGIEER